MKLHSAIAMESDTKWQSEACASNFNRSGAGLKENRGWCTRSNGNIGTS